MAEENNDNGLNNAGSIVNSNKAHISEGGSLITTEQRKGKRENVRSQIALNFILGFFLIIFMAMCIGWYFEFKTQEFKDMLVSISGILGGPLGFIIGFYFKDTSD